MVRRAAGPLTAFNRQGGDVVLRLDVADLSVRNILTMDAGFQCAGCGEWNSTSVDEAAGRSQSYIEDCQVCCKPNLLRVRYDATEQEFVIAAELE